jgi:hypothetical protein
MYINKRIYIYIYSGFTSYAYSYPEDDKTYTVKLLTVENIRPSCLQRDADHSASAYLSMYYIAWNTNSLFFFFPLIGKLHYIYYFFVSDGRYTLFGKVAYCTGERLEFGFQNVSNFMCSFDGITLRVDVNNIKSQVTFCHPFRLSGSHV